MARKGCCVPATFKGSYRHAAPSMSDARGRHAEVYTHKTEKIAAADLTGWWNRLGSGPCGSLHVKPACGGSRFCGEVHLCVPVIRRSAICTYARNPPLTVYRCMPCVRWSHKLTLNAYAIYTYARTSPYPPTPYTGALQYTAARAQRVVLSRLLAAVKPPIPTWTAAAAGTLLASFPYCNSCA